MRRRHRLFVSIVGGWIMQPHRCTIRACQSCFSYSDEKPYVKQKLGHFISDKDCGLYCPPRLWDYLDLPQAASTLPLAVISTCTQSLIVKLHLYTNMDDLSKPLYM